MVPEVPDKNYGAHYGSARWLPPPHPPPTRSPRQPVHLKLDVCWVQTAAGVNLREPGGIRVEHTCLASGYDVPHSTRLPRQPRPTGPKPGVVPGPAPRLLLKNGTDHQ
jgi:hypothetical protein